jgi:hypothetical protein
MKVCVAQKVDAKEEEKEVKNNAETGYWVIYNESLCLKLICGTIYQFFYSQIDDKFIRF